MGQGSVVTLSQVLSSCSFNYACSIVGNEEFQFWLMIFLLDVEHKENVHTLENICVKSLAAIENREDYTKFLPSHLEKRLTSASSLGNSLEGGPESASSSRVIALISFHSHPMETGRRVVCVMNLKIHSRIPMRCKCTKNSTKTIQKYSKL